MAKREKKIRIPNWGIYLICGGIVLLVLLLIYFVFFHQPQPQTKMGVTHENYLQLNIGMSKDQVFRILGEDSCIIAGFTTENGKSQTSYSCANSDGSNIQLIMVDDLLSSKSEFGFNE